MSIKLIIFDLDGTLVDSLPDLAVATNVMLAQFGRPALDHGQVRRLIGQGARRLVERALAGGTEEEIAAGLLVFLQYNDTHIAERTTLYPGVPETLERLHEAGFLLAVLSNKNVALCRKLLDLFGIGRYFRVVFGADSLPYRKPSPEPVLALLREFVTAPHETVLVGDSINDIAAGNGAGVTTVGCDFGYGDAEELAEAAYRVASFPQLLALPCFLDVKVPAVFWEP